MFYVGSGYYVLTAYEDWSRLVFNGGTIGSGASVNGVPPIQSPHTETTMPDPTTDFEVAVQAPANQGTDPGNSLTRTFVVRNLGAKADTYTVEVASSAGWASLAGLAPQLELEAGQSLAPDIPVTVPDFAPIGAVDEITVSVRSQGNPLIEGSGTADVVCAAKVVGPEQQITNYTGAETHLIGGLATYGDWVLWLDRLTSGGTVSLRGHNVATGEDRLIASGFTNYYDRVVDIYGSKVAYSKNDYAIYLYDLDTGVEQKIVDEGFMPRVDGNRVIYIAAAGSRYGDVHAYDIASGTSEPILEKGWEDFGNTTQWVEWYADYDLEGDTLALLQVISPTSAPTYNVVAYDFGTGTHRYITESTDQHKHVKLANGRVTWEDDRTGAYATYVHDLASGEETRASTYQGPVLASICYTWPDLCGDRLVEARGTYDAANSRVITDLYLKDLVGGDEQLLAGEANRGGNEVPLAFDDDRVVYTRGSSPTNLYIRDLASPVDTSISSVPAAPGASGWFTTLPEITLTPSRADARAYYQFDATDDAGWIANQGPFNVPDGNHTLYYYSADRLGNKESAQERRGFKVDTTAPLTSAEVTGGATYGQDRYHSVAPDITLACDEPATSYYQWDATDAGSWST